MKTVADNRRDWLELLIQRHGSIAALNLILGRAKTDATLSQIRNQSPHNRTGKPRTMGDKVARDIESKLRLHHGVMDHAPSPYDAQQSTNKHSVHEQVTVYQINTTWPFQSISPAEWSLVPSETKRMLEQQIKALIPDPSIGQVAA